jgi:hypothetical protein
METVFFFLKLFDSAVCVLPHDENVQEGIAGDTKQSPQVRAGSTPDEATIKNVDQRNEERSPSSRGRSQCRERSTKRYAAATKALSSSFRVP